MFVVNECCLLMWLVVWMLLFVMFDWLILVGFLGGVIVGMGYVFSMYDINWLWVVILGYFINWFGDLFDGSLVCFCKIEWLLFGYFIDYSIDVLGNMIMFVGLGFSLYLWFDVVLFGLVVYLLLLIYIFFVVWVVGEFCLFYMVGGLMELWIMLIVMMLVMFLLGLNFVFGMIFLVFDWFIGMFVVILIVLFVV